MGALSKEILRVENLLVPLGGVAVLRDISFGVKGGETIALVGHNGAGKTTTLRTLMGILQPTNGHIVFEGESLLQRRVDERARMGIGYAPEDRRMISSMTVEENLELPLLASKAPREYMERALAILPELAGLRTRWATALSGGQQKIVALGRALTIGRKLLLLDEPFQGLAPSLARQYSDALKRIRRNDKELSIVISESNRNLVEDMADRVYEMERGVMILPR